MTASSARLSLDLKRELRRDPPIRVISKLSNVPALTPIFRRGTDCGIRKPDSNLFSLSSFEPSKFTS